MLTLTVTTSAGKIEYRLDLPVNDKIELHYDQCDYCDSAAVRREIVHIPTKADSYRFCSGYHRKVFSVKGMAHTSMTS